MFKILKGILRSLPVLRNAKVPAVMLFEWDHDDASAMSSLLPSTSGSSLLETACGVSRNLSRR
jgi:hypothetical protein